MLLFFVDYKMYTLNVNKHICCTATIKYINPIRNMAANRVPWPCLDKKSITRFFLTGTHLISCRDSGASRAGSGPEIRKFSQPAGMSFAGKRACVVRPEYISREFYKLQEGLVAHGWTRLVIGEIANAIAAQRRSPYEFRILTQCGRQSKNSRQTI